MGQWYTPMSLSEMSAETQGGSAETLQTLRDAPCATIGKRIARSGQVAELWCYKWNHLGSIFRLSHVFTNVTCSHWLELRHYVLFRSEYDHIWPLTLSLDSSKAIRSHWPRMTQYLLIVAKLTWVIWCPSEVTVSFLVIFCIFFRKGHDILPECHTSQLFDQDTDTTCQSITNWTGNSLVKVSVRYD